MNNAKFSVKALVYLTQCVICTYIFLGKGFISNPNFAGAFFASIVLNYYIFSFLYGWKMPTILLTLVKGKHDIHRLLLFLFFCFLWGLVFIPRINF